ncbi:hypothetical protein SHVI106290_10665 [Shewanella violacea]
MDCNFQTNHESGFQFQFVNFNYDKNQMITSIFSCE